MKIFSYIIIVLSIITIVFNAFKIEWNNPLYGNSTIALIGIVAGFCAICVSCIYLLSQKIKEKVK